jgi:hypothetical protein
MPGAHLEKPGLRRWVPGSSIGHVVFVNADVIVALGGGITVGGEPQPSTVARARRAAVLYRSGRARRIVMPGAYGRYDPLPPRGGHGHGRDRRRSGRATRQDHCRDPVA